MEAVSRECEMVDMEWFALIMEAKQLGLSLEEIRDFLFQKVD